MWQINLGEELILTSYEYCLVGCFLVASIVHFDSMRNTMANVWHSIGGVIITDLGEKDFVFRYYYEVDVDSQIIDT
ncbi:hypothetical protein Gotri_007087 [Gossypium trilobum]|uniref:DUF4283 domain-containing protein n=2 Tax=Gossypium TaxID=3633 RepID=A0A7J9JGJ4_9ROSI|nr:hypothetical protein [Gossypium trilobum]MBA0833532.1 hypothetical protein [Gossypium armourianum]